MQRHTQNAGGDYRRIVSTPQIAKTLFDTPRFVLLWLAIRVSLGWSWLHAGQSHLHDRFWMSGDALRDAWAWNGPGHVLAWFAASVAIGQTLLGIALILGLFTGPSAIAGSTLASLPLLAGSAAIDPLAFLATLALAYAWKVAGLVGLDRWVLPLVFTRRNARVSAVGQWHAGPATVGGRDAPG